MWKIDLNLNAILIKSTLNQLLFILEYEDGRNYNIEEKIEQEKESHKKELLSMREKHK